MRRIAALITLCEMAPLIAADPIPGGPGDALGEAPSHRDLDDLFAASAGLYRQDDHGGNPHVNEDASVYEGIIFVQKNLGAHDAASLNLLGDIISAASYDRFKNAAISTGATGYNPGHLEADVGWRHRQDDWGLGATGSYGVEFAYKTKSFGLTGDKSFNEDNTRLAARFHFYDDWVRDIRYDGVLLPDHYRFTSAYGLSWTQMISRDTVADLALDYTLQHGFLSTSFNSVFVNGVEQAESAPSMRHRMAATLRGKWAQDERQSWELGVRGYGDNWGVRSFTGELHYFRYVADHSVLLEPSARMYHQSPADFFATDFSVGQPYMTSDSDLGGFNGYQLTLTATLLNVAWLGPHATLSASLAGYYRDDGLLLVWTVFGVSTPF